MRKEDFIKDKWYEYAGWYIKFDYVDSDGYWHSSEEIDTSYYYRKMSSCFGRFDTPEPKVLITDLSVIREYLPSGHPDKIELAPLLIQIL